MFRGKVRRPLRAVRSPSSSLPLYRQVPPTCQLNSRAADCHQGLARRIIIVLAIESMIARASCSHDILVLTKMGAGGGRSKQLTSFSRLTDKRSAKSGCDEIMLGQKRG